MVFERGAWLLYVISSALGAAPFTVLIAASTMGRVLAGMFLRWSASGICLALISSSSSTTTPELAEAHRGAAARSAGLSGKYARPLLLGSGSHIEVESGPVGELFTGRREKHSRVPDGWPTRLPRVPRWRAPRSPPRILARLRG